MKIYLTFNVKLGITAILLDISSKLNESMEVSIMKLLKRFESSFLCLF